MAIRTWDRPDTTRPFWMDAKKEGKCHECEDRIEEGDRIVWDPKNFYAYCSTCGEDVI